MLYKIEDFEIETEDGGIVTGVAFLEYDYSQFGRDLEITSCEFHGIKLHNLLIDRYGIEKMVGPKRLLKMEDYESYRLQDRLNENGYLPDEVSVDLGEAA